jgi:predicted ferric reductase
MLEKNRHKVLLKRILFTTMFVVLITASLLVTIYLFNPFLARQIIAKVISSWPWYIVRGSGIVAAISLIILTLSGIGSISGLTFKYLEPITAWATHRALGIIFGISIILHMGGLLFDHFVSFSLLNVLVPWLSNYKPVTLLGIHLGSIAVALGILAFYAVALVIITSLIWVESKPYLWKLVHMLSYVVLVFVFVHALYLGTDLQSGLLRWLWITVGIGGFGLIAYRLSIAKTI